MTKAILTNPKVAATMSELELRARAGDPWAQQQLQQQCMGFATAVMDDVRDGADMTDRKQLIKQN